MLPWKLRKRQILPVSQNLSSLYFSLAKFQLVSCNLSLAIIWQMTYTQKLPKLCSATLIYLIFGVFDNTISLSAHHYNTVKCQNARGKRTLVEREVRLATILGIIN